MADYARPEMLVDAAWLQDHLNDPDLRVVDCDVPDQYRRGHIPGAVCYMGPSDHYYKSIDDRRFIMPPDEFARAMASLGIGDSTQVIAYDNSSSLYAGRLWWCLNYYGHPGVRVLNGGWPLWLAEGRAISLDIPKVTAPGPFTPAANESIRANVDYVRAAIDRDDIVILDVRSDAEWQGTNDRGNKRAGHIPNAVHLEWLNNVEPEGARRLKSADDLRRMFEAAGVTPDKEIVTVCQGGIRAAQAAMTLTLLGYPKVRDYDGSHLDWSNREDTPLV